MATDVPSPRSAVVAAAAAAVAEAAVAEAAVAEAAAAVAVVLPLLPHPVAHPGAVAVEAVDGDHVV